MTGSHGPSSLYLLFCLRLSEWNAKLTTEMPFHFEMVVKYTISTPFSMPMSDLRGWGWNVPVYIGFSWAYYKEMIASFTGWLDGLSYISISPKSDWTPEPLPLFWSDLAPILKYAPYQLPFTATLTCTFWCLLLRGVAKGPDCAWEHLQSNNRGRILKLE